MNEFSAGQIWKYKTRPGEEASRLVVCKVETHEKFGTIIHIHVEDLAIKNPRPPGGVSRVIGHLPFAEEALRQSVVTIAGRRKTLPDYEEGYKTWKEAFDAGKAGIFTVPVAEVVAFMEQALNK